MINNDLLCFFVLFVIYDFVDETKWLADKKCDFDVSNLK